MRFLNVFFGGFLSVVQILSIVRFMGKISANGQGFAFRWVSEYKTINKH